MNDDYNDLLSNAEQVIEKRGNKDPKKPVSVTSYKNSFKDLVEAALADPFNKEYNEYEEILRGK